MFRLEWERFYLAHFFPLVENVLLSIFSGSIFDNDSVVHSAFRYEFEKYNNFTGSSLKLDRYERTIEEKGDNDVVKASKYFICEVQNLAYIKNLVTVF